MLSASPFTLVMVPELYIVPFEPDDSIDVEVSPLVLIFPMFDSVTLEYRLSYMESVNVVPDGLITVSPSCVAYCWL